MKEKEKDLMLIVENVYALTHHFLIGVSIFVVYIYKCFVRACVRACVVASSARDICYYNGGEKLPSNDINQKLGHSHQAMGQR